MSCRLPGILQPKTHCCILHRFPRRELRRVAVCGELVVELVCTCLDGHACAVEALWKQHSSPAQPVVCAGKFQLHRSLKLYAMAHLQPLCVKIVGRLVHARRDGHAPAVKAL